VGFVPLRPVFKLRLDDSDFTKMESDTRRTLVLDYLPPTPTNPIERVLEADAFVVLATPILSCTEESSLSSRRSLKTGATETKPHAVMRNHLRRHVLACLQASRLAV